ncbi:hypothetical protein HDN1F_04490 [gamma proteobacterium HdN1]|nr:hypothetical protein HDN1F_04490 [gamma proteobacterium HdN1]
MEVVPLGCSTSGCITRRCLMEAIAVLSVVYLMNVMGVYATTDAVPEASLASQQVAHTQTVDAPAPRPSLLGALVAVKGDAR